MKFLAISSIIMAGLVAGPIAAKQPGNDIEVSAPSSVAAWSESLAQDIDRNIDHQLEIFGMRGDVPTGLASVRFTCSETGEPANIELIRRSGDQRMNSLAKSVVGDIKSLHPLPSGVGEGQVFVANVLVAADQKAYDRDMAKLRDEAQRQNRVAMNGAHPIMLMAGAVR